MKRIPVRETRNAKRECPSGCGKCCDPVVLPYRKHEIMAIPDWRLDEETRTNRRFVIEHLTELDRVEGLRLTPYLKQRGQTFAIIEGDPTIVLSHFYRCDQFDPDTRMCTAYDTRPPMCSQYPFYDTDPAEGLTPALPTGCIYESESNG